MKSLKTKSSNINELTLLSSGNGYEFVSTYKIKNLSRKTKSRQSKLKKTKTKKRKNKQHGGNSCNSQNNDYLLVNGLKIPESNHAPALEVNDTNAKLIQDTSSTNELINHPHVSVK